MEPWCECLSKVKKMVRHKAGQRVPNLEVKLQRHCRSGGRIEGIAKGVVRMEMLAFLSMVDTWKDCRAAGS